MYIKGFDKNLVCREFQFEVGNEYKIENEGKKLELCSNTVFHFCDSIQKVHKYYVVNENNRFCEIEVLGNIVSDDEKCGSDHIKIIREIVGEELDFLIGKTNGNSGIFNTGNRNTGNRNTGNRNTGNRNTGDWNTGDWNTGDWNTGDCNTGNCNTGDCNTGNRNTGDCNTGNRNTGDCNTGNRNTGNRNTGDCNTGNRNTGDWNTGNRNTGNRNTGNRNTGDWNTGDWNTGDCNTGDCNTGDCNTGNRNTGDWNTGDWNTGDWNTGIFNTEERKILIFDKESDMTYEQWYFSNARYLLKDIPKNVVEWICEGDMTEEEKSENPTYKTTGGYLKVLDESECAQMWWDGLSEKNRKIIKDIPNFDADKFKECTGIEVK